MSKSRRMRRKKGASGETGFLGAEGVEVESILESLRREPYALLIALVIFFRPWRDGVTYPSFNFYFCWPLFILAAI